MSAGTGRQSAAARPGATLYLGGSVYNQAEPFATAMLVAEGTIAWIGPDGAAAAHRQQAAEVVQLAGALVAPAFVDAHVHTTASGMVGVGLDLTAARSLAEMLAAVRTRAIRTRTGGDVIVGFGWDERTWAEPRPPLRIELDRAADGAVVFLDRADVHGSVVSSALLAAYPHIREHAGFDDSGWLTGPAHHAARSAVYDALPAQLRLEVQRTVRTAAAARGIGSFHEMGGPALAGARDLIALLDLAAAEPGPSVVGYWADGVHRSALPDARIRGRAGDLFADGTMGSHTAALRESYADAVSMGRLDVTAGSVRDHVVACTGDGLQAGYHVIGDGAIDVVLAGFDEAAEVIGDAAVRAGRHRLEHVELVHPEHIEVMARLGLTASVQPRFDEFWGGPAGMYAARLGQRWEQMNPFAALQASGVGLALGSDSPVTPLGPWEAVQAAAWHHAPTHRLSVRAAFAAHTRGGWRAAGRDGGVLAVGEPATFAVWQAGDLQVQAPDSRVSAWSTDPRSGTPGLPDLAPGAPAPVCLRTVVDGTVVHDRPELLERTVSR
jgi:predicted amidohydrolase YtcJ